MERPEGGETAPAGGRRIGTAVVMGVAVLVLALAGFGVAAAQTEPGPAGKEPGKGLGHKGFRHKVMFGGFGGGAIHGELTVPGRDGGYRTLATQVGAVTSVSASEIAVKSADGFSRTYAVDDDTLVNAGRDGIGDVKTGDEVRVMAVVEDGDARAVQVADTTNIRRSMDRWRPGPRPR